uniref:Bifunctional inhibitor/plant lipid transfer protein/seed storage helical domain-containing protein n=1 Tax=Oryza punctata TaxID=4537 RepID=A0A0E0LIC6_ORYPU
MKIIFVFALLAIVACTASAQFDTLSQSYWQYQLQPDLLLQQQGLSPCNEFVRQQYSIVVTPFWQPTTFQLRNNQVMQQQCCQQLRLVAQQSHYQAISSVQAIVQQLQLQQFGGVYFGQTQAQAQTLLALNLPSICGIYPNYYSAHRSITTVGGNPTTMKIISVFALLAIVACTASAQFDTLSQSYWQYQLQPDLLLQQQMLSPCNEFVRQQYSIVVTPFWQPTAFQLRNNQVMQQQCCQQLRLVAQQSHYQAISSVQTIVQLLQLQQFGAVYFDHTQAQAQALLALNLPSICGIYPNYYSAPRSIATVGGVWY